MWKKLEPYKSSIILLSALLVGGMIGIYSPDFAMKLKPFGQIFLNLLFMIIVPLVSVSAGGSPHNLRTIIVPCHENKGLLCPTYCWFGDVIFQPSKDLFS